MMSKKTRFMISKSVQTGLAETISAVENNQGRMRFEVIAISRLETDPENPRELKLTADDVRDGLKSNDPYYKDKIIELESLSSLAFTIKEKGLINPIVVYKYLDKYRLVAGERRFLASLLAEKDDIQARVLEQKPNGLDLRLLQWIENTEREDLSLKDRLANIKSIITEYKKKYSLEEVTGNLIKDLLGISRTQGMLYAAIFEADAKLQDEIEKGTITNLDKAAFIARLDDPILRNEAIQAFKDGMDLQQARRLIESKKIVDISLNKTVKKQRGRVPQKIKLGYVSNPKIIKQLIELVVSTPKFKNYQIEFSKVSWNNFSEVRKAFEKLLLALEKEVT